MKYIKKLQIVTGALVTGLFFLHVVLMTLFLVNWIQYSPFLKYSGIGLVIVMIIHAILCVFQLADKHERDQKFYKLKWITGIIICLILIVHGTDYVKEVNFLWFHFHKGVAAACIETIFLVMCVLHIRINVGAICNRLGMGEKKKLIWSRISCAIATLTILLPTIAIWNYFM